MYVNCRECLRRVDVDEEVIISQEDWLCDRCRLKYKVYKLIVFGIIALVYTFPPSAIIQKVRFDNTFIGVIVICINFGIMLLIGWPIINYFDKYFKNKLR